MRDLGAERVNAARDERGFTLIEALIAIFVLLAGLLSAVGVFSDSRDQNATGERHEIALIQAEEAMEEMRGIPYAKLMLDAGAVDPTGGARVIGAGADFRVRPDLDEKLVYYNTEGKDISDAWISPTSTVSVGPAEAPLEMTIYRFVSWRDEECRVVDLSQLGLNLPGAITSATTPLTNVVNSITGTLLNLLSGTNSTALNALKTRLNGLNSAFQSNLSAISAAVGGITELDLCDIDLTVLGQLQQLGKLTPALGVLSSRLTTLNATLNNLLGSLCLPLIGCVLANSSQNTTVNNAITSVNQQLNCMFGSNSGQTEFNAYLDGIRTGLENLAAGLGDTKKNTKRITVAVVVEPRNGVGPYEPVWASSVVRDPSAALLSSSASCL